MSWHAKDFFDQIPFKCNTHVPLKINFFFLCFSLKESCILLNFLPGTAMLIKEDLQQFNVILPTSTKKKTKKEEEIVTMLAEHGVKYLTIEQATRIINSRLDWPKVT